MKASSLIFAGIFLLLSNYCVGQGGSSVKIVTPGSPSAVCRKAALELQKYIKRATGDAPDITSQPGSSKDLILVQGTSIGTYLKSANAASLGTDGYSIQSSGSDLVIAGGSGKGILYGVYTYLEKFLGFRLYAPGVMRVPSLKSIPTANISLTEKPVFVLRDVFYAPAFDSLYSDWHKIVHAKRNDDSMFGVFAHTTFQMLPPKTYFKDHPEYYALVDGKRQATQIDPTNAAAYNIAEGWMNAKIKNQPQFNYWSVSAEDNNKYCQCDNCKKVINTTQSTGGPMILFANRMAQRFPKETISVLAYSFTRNPPKNVTLAPNLNIMYCPRTKNYVAPYTGAAYDDLHNDMAGWLSLTKNVFIWDYVIDYAQLESLYPNLLTLKPNIQYFAKNGAKGYFAEGNFYANGEFAELRSYMLAKLIWDPNADDKAILDDFLKGYYGNAAPNVKQYILQTSSQLSNGPDKLTEDLIDNYYQLLTNAEKSVKTQAVYQDRVQRIKMAFDYTAVQYYLGKARKESGAFFAKSQRMGKYNNYLEEFLTFVKKFKIQRLVHNDNNLPMYQFYSNWKNEMGTIQQKALKSN